MSKNNPMRRAVSLPVSSHTGTNHHGNRDRSITEGSITSPKHPEPYMSIPAQSLVQDDCRVHSTMVRKENKYNMWQDRYLVLHKGCMYYYKDSRDKSAKGQFSLSGYRISTAPERSKFQWTFKLSHIQPEKRTFYFAAHSEKELNKWFQKIKEDMAEYCEPLGTRSGYNPLVEVDESSSSSSSEDGEALKYDYPIMDPPDMNLAKALQIAHKDSQGGAAPTQLSTVPEYCPAPAFDWSRCAGSRLGDGPPAPPPRVKVPTPLVVLKSGKASVDVSSVLRQRGPPQETLSRDASLHPTPKPRIRRSPAPQARVSMTCPTSLPARPVKSSLHRFASDPELLCGSPSQKTAWPASRSQPASPDNELHSDEDSEGEDDYLKLLPDDKSPGDYEPPVGKKLSTLERMRPEGKSFHNNPRENNTKSQDVLPPSAVRLDIDKSQAIPLLEGLEGMYILHKSSKGDVKKCLSVCTGDKVRHFLIFYNEEGYALHHEGQRSTSIEELVRYYYTKPLPNQQSAKLVEPYH